MAFSLKKLLNFQYPFYERTNDGTHFYYNDANASWDNIGNKLNYGYTNPVLLPILQLISHYVTKVEFKIYKKGTDKPIEQHAIIDLLENPNFYQSKQDFLAQLVWFKYCLGYTYLYPINPDGMPSVEYTTSLNNLNVSLVNFPNGFVTPFNFSDDNKETVKNTVFEYDTQNQNLKISIKDIITFFDLPNGINGNLLTAPSRLDALQKPLSNIQKSFDAKNIIIQSNGKELFTNKSATNIQALPINPNEKSEIQNKLTNNFGLGFNRSRSVVTNSDIEWKSLHINLKDLGLDDSVIKDAQMIVNAFNIPRELISFDGKGAKYENQLQATVGFIQGVVQEFIDDFCNSLMSFYKIEDLELKGSFNHLPIMQVVENKKADSVKKKAEAIKTLVDAGFTKEQAIELLGLQNLEQ